jgi:iron complex outermembrane receptor protein
LLDTEVKEWTPVDDLASVYPTVVRKDASGLELPNAPKFSGNLMLAYEIPAGPLLVTPALDVIHRGSSSGDITPESYREEYTLTGVRVSIGMAEGSPWSTQLWVRNLTDEQYYVSGQTGGNFTYTRTMGMPRTWGVTFQYNLQ